MRDFELKSTYTDVLVVGSEGAGARAAIEAHEKGAKVLMVTKGCFGRSGVTLMAPFSCCVALGHEDPTDNPFEHFKDTVIGGYYLSNQRIVEVFTENAPRRIIDLERFGAKFEKHPDGRFKQVIMPGHSHPRAVHWKFQTGIQFRKALMSEVHKRKIEVREDFLVSDVFVDSGKVVGALALDLRSGEFWLVNTKSVVLATGGAMELYYPHSDAASELTGDGYALALRAGAELADMEFVQFFPTGLVWPPALVGVIWIGQLRYKLSGWLYNKYGERFMKKWDPERMELSTRDMVSKAIVTEILEGRGSPHGGVYLDVSYLGDNIIDAFVQEVFPNYSFRGYNLLKAGLDIRKDAMEVAPVAHFFMGGIRIDEKTQTSVGGLFAAGEVTAGVNGANRIEGNALAETQVFGAIAGEEAAKYAQNGPRPVVDKGEVERRVNDYIRMLERTDGVSQLSLRRKLQEVMWKSVGVIRDGKSLEQASREIEDLRRNLVPKIALSNKSRAYNREWFEAIEVQNMALVADAMAKAALLRKESRGAHFRKDYPQRDDNNWLVNIFIALEGDEIKLHTEPVVVTKLLPDSSKMPVEVADEIGGGEHGH